ncbi:blue light receptor [Nowakowskiella sp. JEL0407]|nr:blue light receptor [Nowakowskiella sp. JEL0407]
MQPNNLLSSSQSPAEILAVHGLHRGNLQPTPAKDSGLRSVRDSLNPSSRQPNHVPSKLSGQNLSNVFADSSNSIFVVSSGGLIIWIHIPANQLLESGDTGKDGNFGNELIGKHIREITHEADVDDLMMNVHRCIHTKMNFVVHARLRLPSLIEQVADEKSVGASGSLSFVVFEIAGSPTESNFKHKFANFEPHHDSVTLVCKELPRGLSRNPMDHFLSMYMENKKSEKLESTSTVSPDMDAGYPNLINTNDFPRWKAKTQNRGRSSVKKRKPVDELFCYDCGTIESPEWRKGPLGPKTLCNACGLAFAKRMAKINAIAAEPVNDGEPPIAISKPKRSASKKKAQPKRQSISLDEPIASADQEQKSMTVVETKKTFDDMNMNSRLITSPDDQQSKTPVILFAPQYIQYISQPSFTSYENLASQFQFDSDQTNQVPHFQRQPSNFQHNPYSDFEQGSFTSTNNHQYSQLTSISDQASKQSEINEAMISSILLNMLQNNSSTSSFPNNNMANQRMTSNNTTVGSFANDVMNQRISSFDIDNPLDAMKYELPVQSNNQYDLNESLLNSLIRESRTQNNIPLYPNPFNFLETGTSSLVESQYTNMTSTNDSMQQYGGSSTNQVRETDSPDAQWSKEQAEIDWLLREL